MSDSLTDLMTLLTKNDLDSVVSQLSLKLHYPHAPVFWRDKTKQYNMDYLQRWHRKANSEDADRLYKAIEVVAQTKLMEKKSAAVREAPAGMRFLLWDDLVALPSFKYIERAITFPFSHTRVASPVTRDNHVSVAAIYNMSAWANWKSSSLGETDRRISEEIDKLKLGTLMRLNHGRRMDQPALFPQRVLP